MVLEGCFVLGVDDWRGFEVGELGVIGGNVGFSGFVEEGFGFMFDDWWADVVRK